MNKLFLRLYVLIVVSVIGIGILLNTVWQLTVEQEQGLPEHELLVSAISLQLQYSSHDKQAQIVQQLASALDLQLTLLDGSEIPQSLFATHTSTPQTVYLEDDGVTALYAKIPQDTRILKLDAIEDNNTTLYRGLLLLVFYSLIAIAVFYWIWPLSKDLNKLEQALLNFNENQWDSTVELPGGSAIAHLAAAYNRLLEKIKRLVNNEKAMANAISHELRTPLARVRFALQMAQETQDVTQRNAQLENIEDDISEMNRLISELLSFATLDDVNYSAKLETGDIGTLVKTLMQRLEKNFPEHRFTFSPTSPSSGVRCDSYLMERALQNLIVNACKYGRRKVALSFFQSEDYYHLRIEDDGDGIPEPMRDKIFDSFFRLPGENKSKGFGIGLAIVKRTMELHRGTISISDSAMGGALFELSWPKTNG